MGYRVIDPGSVEPTPDRPCVQRAYNPEDADEAVRTSRSAHCRRRATHTHTTSNQKMQTPTHE